MTIDLKKENNLKILELKNKAITKIKNSMDGFNPRLDSWRICELKIRLKESIKIKREQTKAWKFRGVGKRQKMWSENM